MDEPARRRTTTAAWYLLLAAIAGLSIWSGRVTSFEPQDGTNAGPTRAGCALVEGMDAATSVGGRSLGSFRADAGGLPGSCVSGVEPTVAIAVLDASSASDLPGSALLGATTIELATEPHPTRRVELKRASSPIAVADVVLVSDGDRTLAVATIWSSVDPIGGSGPGDPDVDGAVALAESLLAA